MATMTTYIFEPGSCRDVLEIAFIIEDMPIGGCSRHNISLKSCSCDLMGQTTLLTLGLYNTRDCSDTEQEITLYSAMCFSAFDRLNASVILDNCPSCDNSFYSSAMISDR
jgi:hypothetical protein